jgi:hypothetical protein
MIYMSVLQYAQPFPAAINDNPARMLKLSVYTVLTLHASVYLLHVASILILYIRLEFSSLSVDTPVFVSISCCIL